MHSRIGCICATFLHCVSSNVSSKHLHGRMHSHIGCICLTFLRCAFLNVFLICLPERMHSYTGSICLALLHCGFSNVFSNCLNQRMHNHTGCICATFLRCVISDFSPGHSLFHSENLLYRHCSQWTQNIEGFYLPYFFGGERLYSPYLCTFVWVVTFYDKKYDSAGKKKWKCFVTLNHLSVSKKEKEVNNKTSWNKEDLVQEGKIWQKNRTGHSGKSTIGTETALGRKKHSLTEQRRGETIHIFLMRILMERILEMSTNFATGS